MANELWTDIVIESQRGISERPADGLQQAGFGLKLGFGATPALILIEFVGAYFIDSSPLHYRDAYPMMQAAFAIGGSVPQSRIGWHSVILTKVELRRVRLNAHLMSAKQGAGTV